MSYDEVKGARLVGHNLAYQTQEYYFRLLDLGGLEGPLGELRLNPALVPVIQALHQVLAGGEVKLEIVHRGHPDIVSELNERLERGFKESNEINAKAGYYLTVTP